MSRAVRFAVFAPIAAFLSGCETPPPAALVAPPPARDRLYTPAEITPGRLQYAREPDAFAPVLTDRVAYPTQEQANSAFARENMASSYPTKGPYVIRASDPLPTERRAISLRLFACKPGVLNSVTGRIVEPRGKAVHCATDFLDGQGRRLARETVNFYLLRRRMADARDQCADYAGGLDQSGALSKRSFLLVSVRQKIDALLKSRAKSRGPRSLRGADRQGGGGGHPIERLILPELCASFCNGAFYAR